VTVVSEKNMPREKGFTLVELLVVISIIALLLSILMPSLNRARVLARRVACQAQLKQWSILFEAYSSSSNGKFHNFWPSLTPQDPWETELKRLAVVLFKPYDPKLPLCPASSKTGKMGAAAWVNWPIKINMPPNTPLYDYVTGSYGENLFATCPSWNPGGEYDSSLFWNSSGVKSSNNAPLFLDSVCPYMFPMFTDPPPRTGDSQFGQPVAPMKYPCVDRHSNGIINSLFVDFSVRNIGLKQLWTLKWNKSFNTAGPWTKEGGVTQAIWQQYAPWMVKFKAY
jgi:prepilin-type N-terminal cleavage/methylation domain-containing protein/prepilin-type processing-associated H-X9-DG protein